MTERAERARPVGEPARKGDARMRGRAGLRIFVYFALASSFKVLVYFIRIGFVGY